MLVNICLTNLTHKMFFFSCSDFYSFYFKKMFIIKNPIKVVLLKYDNLLFSVNTAGIYENL